MPNESIWVIRQRVCVCGEVNDIKEHGYVGGNAAMQCGSMGSELKGIMTDRGGNSFKDDSELGDI